MTERVAASAAGRPLHLLAHSMGGLVAAHLLGRTPQRYRGALITSPLWRYAEALPLPLVRVLSATMTAVGRGRDFAPGERPWALDSCLDMRTSDPAGRRALADFAATHRGLVRGGSTWGWTGAAARAMALLDRVPLDRVDIPVVVVSARQDRTVSRPAMVGVTRRLPHGRLVEVDGGHDVFKGSSDVRRRLWDEIDRTFQAPAVTRRE